MTKLIDGANLPERVSGAILVAWETLGRKVSGGFFKLNKEASMQLQFAYLLQQILPLTLHTNIQRFDIELESTFRHPNNKRNNIDVLVTAFDGEQSHRTAIELKKYNRVAASGRPRSAQDIFKKDVYEDLAVLEAYVDSGTIDKGIALVMTDYRGFVFPRSTTSKSWAYNISHDHTTKANLYLNVPIGGKDVSITLLNSYRFNWRAYDSDNWFMVIEQMG